MVSFSNLLASMFRCWGHSMSQIHLFFFALSSNVKSGLFAVVFLRRWNSKSHTSFHLLFSNTAPRSYRSLYQTTPLPTSSYSFAQVTAMTISALLSLDKYSLFVKTLHPATRCSMVSSLSWHFLQCSSWTNPLAAFHDLVYTICSSIVMIENVFLSCKFWLNQRWHLSSCSW